MEKRNKLWRKRHQWRLFKKRVVRLAAAYGSILNVDGIIIQHPHWQDVAKQPWAWQYKNTGTPCSCWMCRGESYNRRDYKKETHRIIREEFE